MFSYKKSVNAKSLKINPDPILREPFSWNALKNNQKKDSVLYTPILITCIKPNSIKKHSSSYTCVDSMLLNTSNSQKSKINQFINSRSIKKSYFPLSKFNLPINDKAKNSSIIQTIKRFQQKIDTKYTKFYEEISSSIKKSIELTDIINYLNKKNIANNDISLLSHKTEKNSNKEIIIGRLIVEIFDIEHDGFIDLEEFLSVCSIYEIFFYYVSFSFFNIEILLKLKEKIKNLQSNFLLKTKHEINYPEYLSMILNNVCNTEDRKAFCAMVLHNKLNFKTYLRNFPIFFNLESSSL